MTGISINCTRAITWLALAGLACASPPSFLARRDYRATGEGITVADTNGDHIPDIIWVGGEQTGVLFGNGNGTFRSGPTSTVKMGFSVFSPIAVDLNGDGKVDIITSAGQNGGGGLGVCFGNGDGTFRTGPFYPTGNDVFTGNIVLADFNGDGIPDAEIATESGVWLFIGKAGGFFNAGVLTPVSGILAGGYSAAADFNGDGKLDVAMATPHGFVVLLGNGDGTLQPPKAFGGPLGGIYLAVADLNLDGRPDVVLISSLAYASVYLNNGSGGFLSPVNASLPTFGPIAIADINLDGIPDLVSASGYIAYGKGNGTFKQPRYYPLPGGVTTSFVALGDLRNNGLTDLVFRDPNGQISVLLSFGKAKYEDGEWTPVTGGSGCGAAADYDLDGKPDLAVNTPNGVSILLGTGKALFPFKPGPTLSLSGTGCLITGDLNGDGIPDLLVTSNGTVVAYLGNGNGTFTQKSATATPTGGYLALGDFNHDGKLDFATSGNLLALGNGDGTFQTPTTIVSTLPYNGFTNIAAADLNGDGWSDLVLTSYYDSYLYVLLNNQQGGFTQTITHAVYGDGTPIEPGQVLLVDLTGAGVLDMVVGGVWGGAAVYFGDGQGGFTYKGEPGNGRFGAGPLVAVGDVNGDGIPDLVTGATTVAVYLGKGDGTFQVPLNIGAGPAPGDLILQDLHGQVSGFTDIVAPDGTGGVMVLINTMK
jgi:hypothetical protein